MKPEVLAAIKAAAPYAREAVAQLGKAARSEQERRRAVRLAENAIRVGSAAQRRVQAEFPDVYAAAAAVSLPIVSQYGIVWARAGGYTRRDSGSAVEALHVGGKLLGAQAARAAAVYSAYWARVREVSENGRSHVTW